MSQKPSPSEKGRFETTPEEFKKITADNDTEIQTLDLKEVLPDIFASKKTERIPRLVEKVWRRACDEIIAENPGTYIYQGERKIAFFFYDVTPAITKAKVAQIKEKIPRILNEAQKDESILDGDPAEKKSSTPEKRQPSALSKLQKEGLPENPPLEVLHMWAKRTLQNMAAEQQTMPLTRDMIGLVAKSDITYVPWWNSLSGMITGSMCRVISATPATQQKPGEPLRLDLIALFGSVFQLYMLIRKGINAQMTVSVQAATLVDKEAGDLYLDIIRRMSAGTQRNLLIEVSSIPRGAPSARLQNAVETLLPIVHGVIFEVDLLNNTNYQDVFPKLYAYGFNGHDPLLGEEELVRLMKKFIEIYRTQGIKTYIKNVESKTILEAALSNECSYISGPLVKPAQKSGFKPQSLASYEVV